jgi:hypothetical protein
VQLRSFKQGWLGLFGDAVLAFAIIRDLGLWRYFRPLFDLFNLGGDIDFVLEHTKRPGWIGDMIAIITYPAVQLLIIAIGLGLIFWDNRRRTRPISTTTSTHKMSIPIIGMIASGLCLVGFFVAWLISEYAATPKIADNGPTSVSTTPPVAPSPIPVTPTPSSSPEPKITAPKVVEAPVPTAPQLPVPTSPSKKPGRNYVEAHVTPEFLVGLYDGNTKLRADTLVSEQVGKWMQVSGPLGEIHSSSKTSALVVFAYRKKPTIYMWFSAEWIARLALLPKNQNINVEGQLKEVTSYNATIDLENCELLDTN